MEREFNLIDEPWICVRTMDGTVKDVSLQELFLNAHTYEGLAGETKSQDFAVLRMLLAVLYTVFSRVDAENQPLDEDCHKKVYRKIWKTLWAYGQFPTEPLTEYFAQWHDRFWLFDETHPFYQCVAVNENGTFYSTSKLVGSIFESKNKPRLFSERKHVFMENKDAKTLEEYLRKFPEDAWVTISHAEAARWLLHLNCFDDVSGKVRKYNAEKGKETGQVACKPLVGRLGVISLRGRNLFETLMLNYVAERQTDHEFPAWENENTVSEFNREIPPPDNQAAWLTVQSRRIFLCRSNGKVCAYYSSGGDYFAETLFFDNEQMTIWRSYQEKGSNQIVFKPARHDRTKMIWQEFGEIAAFPQLDSPENDTSEGKQAPGVIKWVSNLLERGSIDENYMISIDTGSVFYDESDPKSLPIIDVSGDFLTFHSTLLSDLGSGWRERINAEIDKCSKAAYYLSRLSIELQESAGASGDKLTDNGEKEQFYSEIDHPFRSWLETVTKDGKGIDDKCQELDNILYQIAKRQGERLADAVGEQAVFGRIVMQKEKREIHSTAYSLNHYIGRIYKIFNQKAGETHGN